MSKLSELNLPPDGLSEEIPVDLPELGGFTQLPPGDYDFRLPANLAECWSTYVLEKGGTHLRLSFDQEHPMIVLGGEHDGEPFMYQSFTSQTRPRGKDQAQLSDLAYLLRDGLKDKRPITGKPQLAAAINEGAGKIVRANIQLTAQCRDDKPIRVEQDGVMTTVEGTMGCGARFYQGYRGNRANTFAIPKDDKGQPATSFVCVCGANLRAFPSVNKFLRRT